VSGAITRSLALRPGVYAVTETDGRVCLVNEGRWGERIGESTPPLRAVLRALAAGPCTDDELVALAGPEAAGFVRRLHAGGWLTVGYASADRALVTFRPTGPHRVRLPEPPAEPRLSRFAVLRRDGDAMVLESPLSRALVEVHHPSVLSLLHELAAPPGPYTRPYAALPAPARTELVVLLAWYGFVHEAGHEDVPDLATEQWGPHELWFHARSRAGYHDMPFGATGWAQGRFPPLPVRHEPWPGTPVPLPSPGPGPLGPALGEVLAARRSVREPGSAPLTLDQLGAFLHWSARATAVPGAPHGQSLRPSPSGGALHGLEIYTVVGRVSGLDPGMYAYDPFGHCLEPVPAAPSVTRQLLAHATAGTGGHEPQMLLVVSARFGRVMRKYRSMAYALLLKDLGALMQTMYLVATAMGLAPCAIGSGDTAMFARATGLDPLVESSVGEFALSTRQEPGQRRPDGEGAADA
jgi:SagB-type dehydrogenase family enzyme